MTDRIKGFYVSLEHDIREDDFARIKSAVTSIRGIGTVTTYVTNPDDWFNRQRIKNEIRIQLYRVVE